LFFGSLFGAVGVGIWLVAVGWWLGLFGALAFGWWLLAGGWWLVLPAYATCTILAWL